MHDRVSGTLADSTPYSANDPLLLAWVRVTEALSFLDAWIRYGQDEVTAAQLILDCKIEKSSSPDAPVLIQEETHSPDLARFERLLCTDFTSRIPRGSLTGCRIEL